MLDIGTDHVVDTFVAVFHAQRVTVAVAVLMGDGLEGHVDVTVVEHDRIVVVIIAGPMRGFGRTAAGDGPSQTLAHHRQIEQEERDAEHAVRDGQTARQQRRRRVESVAWSSPFTQRCRYSIISSTYE